MPKTAALLLPLLLLGAGCATTTEMNTTANVGTSSNMTSTSTLGGNTQGNSEPSTNASGSVNTNVNLDDGQDDGGPLLTTIVITSAGFSPATVTVAAGSIVTFQNNDSVPHWPASDPHPTHTNLPGFDAQAAIAAGGSYSFVFTQTGSWGYHDHLNPGMKGTVIVK